MNGEDIRFALLLSVAAGLVTVLGGVVAVCLNPSRRILAGALGFAAGVMVTVSVADLLPEAAEMTMPLLGWGRTAAALIAALLGGVVFSLGMDRLSNALSGQDSLRRLGFLSMMALLLHNLPEGMAVFVGVSADRTLGLSLAGAVALHNFPEGMSVAMPIYASTKSRKQAVALTALSGMAEPFGAWLTWRLWGGQVSPLVLAMLFAGIAGMMTCLAVRELFPEGMRQDTRFAAVGAVLGAAAMILSLQVV